MDPHGGPEAFTLKFGLSPFQRAYLARGNMTQLIHLIPVGYQHRSILKRRGFIALIFGMIMVAA